MGPEVPFLRAIARRFWDDGPRLIYADFLEESGLPEDRARSTFIRTQCALARLEPNHPARPGLLKRQAELLHEFQATWTHDVADLVTAIEFRRGVLESVTLTGRQFLRHGRTLLTRAPVRRVRVIEPLGDLDRLARSPLLVKLRELDLSGSELGSAGVAAVVASPHLDNLRVLELGYTASGDGAAGPLADARLPKLQELGLAGNRRYGDAAIARFERVAWFAQLRLLDLSDNTFTGGSLAALSHLRLRELRLAHNPLGDDGVAELVRSPLYTRLVASGRAIDLSGVGFGTPGTRALADAAPSAGLVTLNLSHNDLGDDGVARLARGHFDHLKSLALARVGLGDRGVRCLAESHVYRQLVALDLSGNRLTQWGVDRLLESRPPTLRLDTSHNLASAQAEPELMTETVNRVIDALKPPCRSGRRVIE